MEVRARDFLVLLHLHLQRIPFLHLTGKSHSINLLSSIDALPKLPQMPTIRTGHRSAAFHCRHIRLKTVNRPFLILLVR